MYEPTQYSNGRSRTSQTSKPQVGDLKTLMAQAVAFFPNQTLPPGTPDVYLKAWMEIAEKYTAERFQNALWNVLRRSEFFPLPKAIEDECAAMKRESSAFKDEEMITYRRDIREHPERFVKLTDIVAEATANVERRKAQKGNAA